LKALKRLSSPTPTCARGQPERKVVPDGPPGHAPDVPEGAARLAELLGALPSGNEFGEHLGLRRWFSSVVGCDPPSGSVDRAALGLLLPEAPDDVADPAQWLFLDTETTGLAGGTGTYPFLIGTAWWDAGGLEVEQFFMREYSEERSVLAALAERLAHRRVLVTFNGKSFDWPLIETRYRMTRTIDAPALRAHIDFLHPARHLWRPRLASLRLTEIERHILGWNRGEDFPSDLIPQIYFDYVRGGPPEPLVSIFRHNQMDLRGLAGLASRTLSLLGRPEMHQDALELYGVSRICERRGERRRARALYERSIASDLPPETERAARRSLARLAKREGDLAFACGLWEKMLGSSREGLEAYEQLAIYYEHHTREPYRAAALAHEALIELRNANRLGLIASGAYRHCRARFEQRLARLERKAGRTLLEAMGCGPRMPADEPDSG
jgi:uncharacterized protein